MSGWHFGLLGKGFAWLDEVIGGPPAVSAFELREDGSFELRESIGDKELRE